MLDSMRYTLLFFRSLFKRTQIQSIESIESIKSVKWSDIKHDLKMFMTQDQTFLDKENFPSIMVETSIPFAHWTPAQKDLYVRHVDVLSDMVNHVATYTDEECSIVSRVVTTLEDMPDTPDENVHDSNRLIRAMNEAFPENCFVDLQIKSGCGWDPRKRDTQIQFRFRLSRPRPTRLVLVPRSNILKSLQPVIRHVGKPFQSMHLTSKDKEIMDDYKTMCDTFVMSVWVGTPGNKVTDTGTGFRTKTFIGSSVSPDYPIRILFRHGLDHDNDALKSSLKDFIDIFDPVKTTDPDVPVLMTMEDFVTLSLKTS